MNRPMRDEELEAIDDGAALSQPFAERPRTGRPWLRYFSVLAVVAVMFGGIAYWFLSGDDVPPPKQVRELTIVNIVPPPPPPPPPPEQKMIEAPKTTQEDIKELEKPIDKPKDEPAKDEPKDLPPDPGTLNAPVGPDGILAKGSGRDGGGGGGGGGNPYGRFQASLEDQIKKVLFEDKRTRFLAATIKVKLWTDATGRVQRVILSQTTGNAETDANIRDVVVGTVLRELPPRDKPMPLNASVKMIRPG